MMNSSIHQDYTIMHGDDNAAVEAWHRLNMAARGGSLPAARAATGFWVADEPPGFPDDDDDSPDGGGPPDNNLHTAFDFHQRFVLNRYQHATLSPRRCACGAVATINDGGIFCGACYWEAIQ